MSQDNNNLSDVATLSDSTSAAAPAATVATPADKNKKLLMPLRLVMVVLAAVLIGAFFMPWGTANEKFGEVLAANPNAEIDSTLHMTASQFKDISLQKYVQIYKALGSYADSYTDSPDEFYSAENIYIGITYAALIAAVLAFLFAALGLPIPTAIFALGIFGVVRLLKTDFTMRGALPNSTHNWGVAPTIYMVASLVLVVVAIVMAVVKHQVKHPKSAA